MYKSIELNKEYSSKAEMFADLKANKDAIIKLKKSVIKQSNPFMMLNIKSEATKGLDFIEDGFIYPVINTTKYFDSHFDTHLDGIWTKTLAETKGGFFYLADHSMKIDSVIAWQKDVEAFTQMIDWSALGKSYPGQTQALIYKIAKDKIVNPTAKQIIEDQRPVENSVSMIYVKIDLGIDSDDKDYKEEKQIFDKYYDEVANKDILKENGYGWFVQEARIYKEGSMVLAGSNDVTPILENTEPEKSTHHNIEPEKSTRRINNFLLT